VSVLFGTRYVLLRELLAYRGCTKRICGGTRRVVSGANTSTR